MLVLFLTSDLVFPSRIAGMVQSLGGKMETVANGEALLNKAAAENAQPIVVLIDLASSAVNAGEFVPKLKGLPSSPRAIIAFGPHVHQEKLAAAEAAGCDLVLTRGQFDAQYAEIFRRMADDGAPHQAPKL